MVATGLAGQAEALAIRMLDEQGVDATLHIRSDGVYDSTSGTRSGSAPINYAVRAMEPGEKVIWSGSVRRAAMQTFHEALPAGVRRPGPGDSITIGTQLWLITESQRCAIAGSEIGWLHTVEAVAA